jgi:hypothetical protein
LVAYLEPKHFFSIVQENSPAAPTTVGASVMGTVPKGWEGGQDFIRVIVCLEIDDY